MSARGYLPSAQFMVIVGALLAAGATVAAAQYYVSARNEPAALSAGTGAQNEAWEESLAAIQAESGINLPEPPDPNTIDKLLAEAQSENLTDSVGRSILVKLTAAGSEGLGSDMPTQDSIIAAASEQVNASLQQPDIPALVSTETTTDSLRTYGNAVIATLKRHPGANSNDTLGVLARATDTRDSAPLSGLKTIQREYQAVTDELAGIAVPKTLMPLHREVVTNFAIVAATYNEMQYVVSDPIRGLAGVQKYQEALAEAGRVFTNIAESLNKSGILFNKDEPGSAWELFLSAS